MPDVIAPTQTDPDRIVLSQSSRPSFIGRVRTCENISLLEWILVICTGISIGVGVGFSIFRIITINAESSELVFSILIIANLLFAIFYLFHGIFQEQPFEIFMLILTTTLLWILIMLNYTSSSTASAQLKLIRFLVSSVLTVPNLIIAGFVGWNYWSSGNLIFKTVGADPRFQKMCRELFCGLSLLAFDAQAAISCIILIMRNGVTNMKGEDVLIIVAGAIFIGVWLCLGYTAMRSENMNLTYLFGVCSLLQPIYVIYLIVQAVAVLKKPYTLLSACIYVASGTLVLTHFSLLAMVTVISFNYGKGLKEKVYGVSSFSSRTNTPTPGSASTTNTPSEPLIASSHDHQNVEYHSTENFP